MNPGQFKKLFPLGSHLCRDPMPPMSEMKRDMENLRQHGFNMVKLQANWSPCEPVEGQYDFARFEELITQAALLDMGVYLGIVCEHAPHWLWRKYPDCRMVGRNGLPIAYEATMTLPSDGKPGPCFDHPGAEKSMRRFIRSLVTTLGRHANVVIWNTWQEIAYLSEQFGGQPTCYCEHTLAFFRRWLQEKHGDLQGLNRAWHTAYGVWEDVAPDRIHTGKECLPQDVAWRYFMDNIQIGRILRVRAEAIREADPLKRPVFAHTWGTASLESGRDWTYARSQDFLGASSYAGFGSGHAWADGCQTGSWPQKTTAALLNDTWLWNALMFDHIRSCNLPGKPVWAAEFQGGPWVSGLLKGRVPESGDIRRWALTSVGSGVSGISYWVTRADIMGAELNGHGLLDSAGDTTPRFEEAARIGAALNRYPELFGPGTLPAPKAAIIINEENCQLCNSMVRDGGHLRFSTLGWHHLFWEVGIPVDFVELSYAGAEILQGYRTLVLPFPISISETLAAKLVRYVEAGGELISEACPGRMDESTFCPRGELSPLMRQLFGVDHLNFVNVMEPDNGARWSQPENPCIAYHEATLLTGVGPLGGHAVRANVCLETFACRGSDPCITLHGDVVGVVRRSGKGRAWLLGSVVGHNGLAYRDAETRACIAALLKNCGVTSAHQGKLLLRKRAIPGREAWFFTNPTEQVVTEAVNVAGWQTVEDLLGEPLSRNGDTIALTVNSLDVRVLVLTK